MTMQKVLDRLETELSTELKEAIIANFNSMYKTSITRISDDERIFSAFYSVLVGTLAHVGRELVEISETEDDELEDIPLEESAKFKMCSSYAAHTMQAAMELAEVTKVIAAIHSDD